jgi:hypothetical protein
VQRANALLAAPACADVRIFDLVKPFEELPREKVVGWAEKLDLWDLRCASACWRHARLLRLMGLPPRRSFKGQSTREGAWNAATRVLPCLVWMVKYDVKKQLPQDIDRSRRCGHFSNRSTRPQLLRLHRRAARHLRAMCVPWRMRSGACQY